MVLKKRVAIVGATGLVGKEIIKILEEKKWSFKEIFFIASEQSTQKEILFHNKRYQIYSLNEFDFEKVDYAIFSVGSELSKIFIPQAVEKGCTVIDNSKAFRYNDDVPLIVPEINWKAYNDEKIIANPNCSTIQLVFALKPILMITKINKVLVSTYQAVSGAGKKALMDLLSQTSALLAGEFPQKNDTFYAFNVIPQIDDFQENGFTLEEMKITKETHKILNQYDLQISATAVRVPVIRGHSESVYIETERELEVEEIRNALGLMKGNVLMDNIDDLTYPMPLYAQNKNSVYIGRIRKDLYNSKAFWMWIVSDNLRRGAAWNALLILKKLAETK